MTIYLLSLPVLGEEHSLTLVASARDSHPSLTDGTNLHHQHAPEDHHQSLRQSLHSFVGPNL